MMVREIQLPVSVVIYIFLGNKNVNMCCLYGCSLAQLYLTLYDLMDYNPPSSSVKGILQAGILKWVAISFSKEPSQPRDQTCTCCISRQILYPLSHQ